MKLFAKKAKYFKSLDKEWWPVVPKKKKKCTEQTGSELIKHNTQKIPALFDSLREQISCLNENFTKDHKWWNAGINDFVHLKKIILLAWEIPEIGRCPKKVWHEGNNFVHGKK